MRPGSEARLGLVYGRRRQGKTMLLEALCEAAGGFLWQARQQSTEQNLRSLEEAVGQFSGVRPRLNSWEDGIGALLELRSRRGGQVPLPVVIDEVGYLLDEDPGFASRLQAALSPGVNRRRTSSIRLILCGSAFGQMRRLVDAGAPLRGRAGLDLVLRPFRFRQAAGLWGVADNPDLAFRLHASGRRYARVPGVRRRESAKEGKPGQLGGRQVVVPRFAAVPGGSRRRGGRPVTDRSSVVLGGPRRSRRRRRPPGPRSRAGWVDHRRRCTTHLPLWSTPGGSRSSGIPCAVGERGFVLDEPIVRLHRLVIEPAEAKLSQRGNGPAVWDDAVPLVRARIYAPHLGRLAREWVLMDASEQTNGGRVTQCGPATLGAGQRKVELDLLAVDTTPSGQTRVCSIGEVKSGQERMGLAELDRLDQAVLLLPGDRGSTVKRLLVARAGFTRQLERRAANTTTSS